VAELSLTDRRNLTRRKSGLFSRVRGRTVTNLGSTYGPSWWCAKSVLYFRYLLLRF